MRREPAGAASEDVGELVIAKLTETGIGRVILLSDTKITNRNNSTSNLHAA